MELLARHSDNRFLKYLTPREHDYIVSNTVPISLAAGDYLPHPDGVSSMFYLIEDGEIEVVDERLGPGTVVAMLPSGEVIGEMAFFAHMSISSLLRARQDSTVRIFNREQMQYLALDAPEILGKITLALCEILGARLRYTYESLPNLVDRVSTMRDEVQIADPEALSTLADQLAEVASQLRRVTNR